jgi:hypothetical protein
VSITRAKPIDRLYDEVADYDLVVVPDAPLASALNRRLEHPHFGPFAITPRRLAARRRETAEDRLAFLRLIEETDLEWKQAATAVGEILQCWEYDGEIDAVLSYDAFDTPAIRTAVECLRSLDTTSRTLTEYEIGSTEYPSVAVVGYEELTTLERSILPGEYTVVDPFLDEPFEPPPFRIFDSPAAVTDAVVETIDAETAEEVAVVLDAGSEYSPLIESALESAEIPFYGGPGFADDQDHRCFLDLIRTAFAGSDTRVSDVRPLLTHLGMTVDVDHDEKRLSETDDPVLDRFCELRGECSKVTVGEALALYEREIGRGLDVFREELDRLGILDEPLDKAVVDRLTFYIETYEVPIERENRGVLLADATSAAFVDRPVVFSLGLDEGWTHSAPRRPWIDRDAEFERNIRQFQSLLQSGVDQHYLVVDTAGGRPVQPTLYFEELLDESFERFSDLESIEHTRTIRPVGDGFERESIGAEIEPTGVGTISQSSLNSFVNCPRDHLFGRLVDGPDKHYFAEGNLFHDFAEFYVTHPDVVDEGATDDLVELMIDHACSFHREIDLDTCRTKYRAGLRTIARYLDERGPDPDDDAFDFLTPSSGWGTNVFAEYFGRPVDSPLTERWFEDPGVRLKGKIDLVAGPDHLLDFKSGSKKSTTDVTKASAMDPPGDPPNYQALLYLTYYRRQRPGEPLRFTFFHFLECLDEVVTGDPALEDCLTTITYRPIAYEEFVTTREAFDGLCEDAPNDCNKTFSKTEYEDYRALFDEVSIPVTRDGNELAESAFGEVLTRTMVEAVGDYKYVQNGCVQACRYLAGLRTEGYFADDLDEFERFVEERLEELNAYRRGEDRFPVEGLGGEPNYRRVDHRDLLIVRARPTATDGGSER